MLTPEQKSEIMSKFHKAQGRGLAWGEKQCFTAENDNAPETIDAPLLTCACCGFRNENKSELRRTYNEVDLSNEAVQSMLKLREDDDNIEASDDEDMIDNQQRIRIIQKRRSGRTQALHRQLMEVEPLSIPYNDNGDTREVELWRLCSVWPAKKPEELVEDKDKLPDYMFDESDNPIYYHLHPEFVQEKVSGESEKSYTATICSECEKVIKSGGDEKVPYPRRSLAAGVDFGDANRIGLEPLTERERQIISKLRHFLLIVKIESNTADGRVKERGQSAVKGCGIYFNHDSPHVVSDLLSQDSINGDISLQFVGPDGEYDSLAKKVLGSANVHGRAWVICQWLKVLQEVNCHYQYDDKLTFDEVTARLKAANDALVKDAGHIDDSSVLRETEIAKDDARHIRTHGSDNQDDMEVDENEKSGSGDIPLRCSYITSYNTNARGTDADREYLKSAEKTLCVKDQQAYTTAMSRREESPLNEYDTGDETLAKACPDVFIFGSAYGNKSPTLDKYQIEHLLMQYTTSAGSNRPLLFQLFESKRRHGVISNMHAKVSSNQKEFEQVANLFVSEEFQTKLKAACKNPDGPDAKYVLNTLSPIMTFAGRKAAFGALERNQSAGEILALGRYHGCASTFLTFGIDDINHPNSIRFAIRSTSNHNFPAVVSSASQTEMKRGIKLMDGGEGSIKIPYGYTERMKLMNNNPVGAANAYKQMVHDVITILIGIKPSNHSGDNNRTTKTEFISPDTHIGMIGTSWAFFGKNEVTHSGSLHFHVVIWGGLSPQLLESVADIPELCEKVALVLDSQFSASIDRHVHIQDLVQKHIGTVEGLKKTRDAAKDRLTALDTSSQDTLSQDISRDTSTELDDCAAPSKSATAKESLRNSPSKGE